MSMGHISLPVYTGGINLMVKFLIVDGDSAYNAILGRPWIHAMKSVSSTCHQITRFPTKYRGQEVKRISISIERML